ncbi:MAG TPA: hypothetical protein PKY24_11370, partial [Opitutaceae bacterium]|nr:hypothetical protein [Opitutaceae bacterium]
MQDRHPVRVDRLDDLARLLLRLRFQHRQRRARPGPPEQLPDRHVEGDRRLLQDDIARADGETGLHPEDAVQQAAMLDQRALGPPRRSRGEDRVRNRARIDRRQTHLARGQPLDVRHEDRLPQRLKRLRELRLTEHRATPEVFENRLETRRRQRRGERHIRRPRAQYRENGDHQVQRTLVADAHEIAARDAV